MENVTLISEIFAGISQFEKALNLAVRQNNIHKFPLTAFKAFLKKDRFSPASVLTLKRD